MRDKLKSLLALFHAWGGLHTYPDGDENQKKLFAGCLELEELGLITRQRGKEEDGWVFWHPETGKVLARMDDDGKVWRFAVLGVS